MVSNTAVVLAILFVGLPWLVILVDAVALGFHFGLSLLMLSIFAVGLLFLAAAGTEG